MANLLLKRIKDWATSITDFRTGDVIPVDGPDGTAKMPKNSLLQVVEEFVRTSGKYLTAIGSIKNTTTYSSYNDLPNNSSALVFTDLNDSPTPSNPDWGCCLTLTSSNSASVKAQILITTASDAAVNNVFYWRNFRSGTWSEWNRIPLQKEIDAKIIEAVSGNNGLFNPEFYNLDCDNSGNLKTYKNNRLSSELIKIEDFVSVSIDPAYEYRLFLFNSELKYLTYFNWRSTKVSREQVLQKNGETKFVRIYASPVSGSALMTYLDALKIKVELINTQANAFSSLVEVEYKSRESAPFDYVSLDATYAQPSIGYDKERYASRHFIPLDVVASVKSRTSSTSYRLALYTSDGGLSSDFIAYTSYTTGETQMSSVSSNYPTAKFFKLLVMQVNNSDVPENESVFIEYEKLHKNVIPFERGNLTDGGTIETARHNADNVLNFAKFRTGRFLDLNGAKSAKVYRETDGDIYVYEFDSSFNFLGKTEVSASVEFTPRTTYIKVMVENATAEPTVYLYSEKEFGSVSNVYSSTFISFLYEVPNVDPTSVEDSDATISQYSSQHYFNSGILQVPPNYTQNGAAVPLIIFNHGSSEYNYRYTRELNYKTERNYLLKEGFAILDCYGVSSKYFDGEAYFVNPGTPDNIACMVGAYEWVTKNYNIDREKVFTMGKSHGGLMTLALAYTKSIPIKAAAFLCPLLNWFEQGVGLGAYSYENRIVIANQLGFENVGNLDTSALETLYSEDYTAYCLGNIDKMVGNNPFLMGIDGTKAYELTSKSISRTWSDQIFESSRSCDTPLKVWGASDDDAVVYAQLKSLVTEIKNGKGIAAFRRMPTGTGGHHSVDNDANALKVASIVTKLGYTCTDVPLAYAEVVQWFRRFYG